MDTHSLQALAGRSAAAKTALEHFAGLGKNTSLTTVDAMQNVLKRGGHDVSRNQAVMLFKSLEEAGCGRFVVGRKGHPSRFEWDIPVQQLSVALERASDEAEVAPVGGRAAASGMPRILEHTFIFREDYTVTLRLPANLTEAEAIRLAEFVKTLPFES